MGEERERHGEGEEERGWTEGEEQGGRRCEGEKRAEEVVGMGKRREAEAEREGARKGGGR